MLVGYGHIGKSIAETLLARDIPFVVVEQNRERVEALRAAGMQAVSGDAGDPAALIQAHIAEAALLVVAAAESTEIRPMIDTARQLNPGIAMVVRAPNAEEAALLQKEGARNAVHMKGALTEVMTRDVLDALAASTVSAAPLSPHVGAAH